MAISQAVTEDTLAWSARRISLTALADRSPAASARRAQVSVRPSFGIFRPLVFRERLGRVVSRRERHLEPGIGSQITQATTARSAADLGDPHPVTAPHDGFVA